PRAARPVPRHADPGARGRRGRLRDHGEHRHRRVARARPHRRVRPQRAQRMTQAERLTEWFASQVPDARDVRVEGLDRVEVGHSAETLLMTLVVDDEPRDVVVRIRPAPPGLLEPYDLERQFTVLRALEATAVRSPAVLWYEPSGEVLGRDFYVMERL